MVKGNVQTINEFNELIEKMKAMPMYYYKMVARVELKLVLSIFLINTD